MGIRFFCPGPDGHKLNVKEHLAGKVGFCPECGVRLVIPYQSTRKSSRELNQEKSAGETAAGAPPFLMVPSVVSPPETQRQPVAGVPPSSTTGPPSTNPILNDPSVVWYIQVPNGPQYGPVTGQVVHAWIQERRIGATMLVWREGWDQWLEAKNVFPELE